MKAEDLMINDWVAAVRTEGSEDQADGAEVVFNVQVKQILSESIIDENGEEWGFGQLRGIPVTTEILKQNGIELVEVGDNGPCTPKLNRNRFEKWKVVANGFISINLWHDRLFCMWWLQDMKAGAFTHVHEFQNALRLCKMYKELKLND